MDIVWLQSVCRFCVGGQEQGRLPNMLRENGEEMIDTIMTVLGIFTGLVIGFFIALVLNVLYVIAKGCKTKIESWKNS